MADRYAITEDVLSTELDDEAVVVHLDSQRCFRLNDTAAAIWRGLAEGLDRDRIVDRLVERYTVDANGAAAETDRLLGELSARGLIRAVAGD